MTEEDDNFLKEFNEKLVQRKDVSTQCSEDVFEEAMNFFEEISRSQQPYSSVGDPPIIAWEDMQNAFDENIDEPARTFAKDIYEYWSSLRTKNSNTPVHPGLRIKLLETTNDADDNDPYVCFRRREVRQVRKTRGRDAQSVEKLRKLRKELEEARALVALVRQREVTKREQLAVDRELFEQRASLRQLKRNLPDQYKDGDEELLINQKVRRPASHPSTQMVTIVLMNLASEEKAAGDNDDTKNNAYAGTTKVGRTDFRSRFSIPGRFVRAQGARD